jgi:putative nucleotidyltransferase with HDIG domain
MPALQPRTPEGNPAALALSRLLGCRPDDLPTLPAAAQEVARLAADPEADVARVVEVIRRDPPLAAKVLRLSNSPMFRTRAQITSLDRAVLVLGLEEIRNLTLGLAVLSSFGAGSLKRRLLRQRLWEHSLVVATLAERLAKEALGLGPGFYSFGLLHDLGKVALEAFRSQDVGAVLKTIEGQRLVWVEAENQTLHFDHAFLGGQLLSYWEFPAELVSAVAAHHQPWTAGEHSQAAGLVFLADAVSRRLGYHCHQAEGKAESDPARGPEAARFLADRGWELEELMQTVGENALAETAADAAAISLE